MKKIVIKEAVVVGVDITSYFRHLMPITEFLVSHGFTPLYEYNEADIAPEEIEKKLRSIGWKGWYNEYARTHNSHFIFTTKEPIPKSLIDRHFILPESIKNYIDPETMLGSYLGENISEDDINITCALSFSTINSQSLEQSSHDCIEQYAKNYNAGIKHEVVKFPDGKKL